METEFFTGSRTAALPARSKLKDILATLKFIYCDTIGAEFAHVSDTEERLWLQDNFQAERIQHRFSAEEKKNILWQLTAAEGLERYLHTKYVGQKRFSLEGGDSLIPLLDELVQQGGSAGIEETIIGMAHRGRLNVLVNLLGKSPKDLFIEFEGHYDLAEAARLGRREVPQGVLRRPEDPVRQRACRARVQSLASRGRQSRGRGFGAGASGAPRRREGRQGARGADPRRRRLRRPGRRHGDAAAVAGPRASTPAARFTSSSTTRSVSPPAIRATRARRCTAPMSRRWSRRRSSTSMPTIPRRSASSRASRSSTGAKFHKDVVIDLVCYRRHGHNEADEPAATQPLMYQVIRKKPTARQMYADKLAAEGVLTRGRSGGDDGSIPRGSRSRASRRRAPRSASSATSTRSIGANISARIGRSRSRRRSTWRDCARSAKRSPPIRPIGPCIRACSRSCRRASAWWRASSRSIGAAPRIWPTRA